MSTEVFHNGSVYSPADPFATAMLVSAGCVEWVGQDAGARSILDDSMRSQNLAGKLITPAFALAATSVKSDQIIGLLDSLASAGYCLAHLMLTEGLRKVVRHQAIITRYYLPAHYLNAHLPLEPEITGIYVDHPKQLTDSVLNFAVNSRLNLVMVPSDNAQVEEFLDILTRLDSIALSRLSPRLDGLLTLDSTLIERAMNQSISLGFSSNIDRLDTSYRLAVSTGASVILGSDPLASPSLLGWDLVDAALHPFDQAAAVSARAAFQSMTRAVYRAQGVNDPRQGQLVPGSVAHFSIWKISELMVQTPDSRISAWSTDPRARIPLLPVLDRNLARPELVALYTSGQKVEPRL